MVVDKGCKLPDGLGGGENADEDARRFYRSEQGIVLVTKPMLANSANLVDTDKKGQKPFLLAVDLFR